MIKYIYLLYCIIAWEKNIKKYTKILYIFIFTLHVYNDNVKPETYNILSVKNFFTSTSWY